MKKNGKRVQICIRPNMALFWESKYLTFWSFGIGQNMKEKGREEKRRREEDEEQKGMDFVWNV